MPQRFDIELFNSDPELVARLARAEDVFSFLNRQIAAPSLTVALVYRAAGLPRVVAASGVIEAGDVRELLFVRTVPFDIEYIVDGLRSKDGFDCTATASLSVHAVAERTELEALRRTLLGSGMELRRDRLVRHFADAVRSALSAFAESHDANNLTMPACWDAFDRVMARHAAQVCFESGMQLSPNPRVTFASDAFQQSQQQRRAANQRADREKAEAARRAAATAAREAHLTEMGKMLTRIKTMAGDGGVLDVAELIKTFDAGQRGRLYEGLIVTKQPVGRTQAVLVVSGSELLWFDPADPRKPNRRERISKDAGPLRSVRVVEVGGETKIIIGARCGVHVADRACGSIQTLVFNDRPDVRGGVNAAAILGPHLYATHSEVGLTQWRLDGDGAPTACLTDFTDGSKSVRDVQVEAGRLWLAVDNLVVGWTPGDDAPQEALPAPAEVTTLLMADGYAVAGLRDGSVVRWPAGDPVAMETIRTATGTIVRSLAWLSGGGVPRLLIGDGRPHLDLLVLGDSYHGEYRCLHELRGGFAAEDLIVGVNDRRDHLFLWDVDKPASPSIGIGVRRLTGHSIQDLALLGG